MILSQDKSAAIRFITATVAVAAILFGCLLILQPFIPALLLATIFCLSAWPGFEWLERKLKGRTTLAAALMTVLLAVCFLVPLLFLGTSLADDFRRIVGQAVSLLQDYPAQPPQSIVSLPLIGPVSAELWRTYAADRETVVATLHNYAGPVSQWLLGLGTIVGHGVLDISLGVLIAFFLFQHGVNVTRMVHNLTDKFVGPSGRHLLNVSKKTVIGVVYGIVGTAVAQGALAGLGYWIAHVPGAAFLGLVTFIFSVIPAGFPLIWLPVTIWLFAQGHIGMGIFMGAWGAIILAMADLIARPYFISMGSNLPLPLVLLGVFGGIIAFSFIGLFIGPTLLAVAYVLLLELSRRDRPDLTLPA